MMWMLAIMATSLLISVFAWGGLYAQRRTDPINRALRLFLLVQSSWIFFEMIFHSPLSKGYEPHLQRITALFWMTIGFWFLHAVYRLIHRPNDWLYYLILALSTLGVVVYWFTDLGITGFVRHDWGVADTPGLLHTPVLTSVGGGGAIIAIALLYWARRKTSDPDQRRSYGLLLLGGILATLLIWFANALVPVLMNVRDFPQLGASALAIICPFLYSAVVRYDFLQLNLGEVAAELFEDSPEGLVLIDPEGRIRRTNPAARKLLDLPDDQSADHTSVRNISAVLPGAVSDRDFSNRLYTIAGNHPSRVLSISQATQVRGSTPRGRILVLQDVTRREVRSRLLERSKDEAEQEVLQRQKELAEAQKMGVIGTLAGGIAHDFNNLLGVVQGFASMTHGDLPSGHPAREKLTAVLEATEKAQELVRQILSFSRPEPPQRRAISSHWVLDKTLGLIEASLPATIAIERRIDEEAGTVIADQQQLEQVLLNLCTNAYQVMGDAGGQLIVTLESVEVDATFAHDHSPLEPGHHVRFSVRDTGPGLDAEAQLHVFDPFFTTRQTHEGTGLGLSTAMHIVRDHGGTITVDSPPGQGASFQVYLPSVSPPRS
jgi:signal transduction histidine kinase